MNLVEALSREIARVTELKVLYADTGERLHVDMAMAIALIDRDLERAHLAMGNGDIVEMTWALRALQEYKK